MNRVLLSMLVLGCLVSVPLHSQQIQINKENKTIAVSTSGEAFALADIAMVHVGFVVYGKDETSTYADASHISNAIMTKLNNAGTPKEAIESTNQDLNPLEPNAMSEKSLYAQGMRFRFSQSWRVTVPADQAAKLLHLAITAGANESGRIDWQLQHDESLQAEAAGKALQHAREIADHMAKGLNAKLGPLVYASNEMLSTGRFPLQPMGFRNMLALETDTSQKQQVIAPISLSPTRITRSATVYAVFSIE